MLDNKEDLEYTKKYFTFYSALNESERMSFESNLVKVSYEKGVNLHNPEGECLGVLLVRSGSLRVYILSEDGREITLYRLGPDSVCVLSASCILNYITFDVHIEAEIDTEVFLLNSAVFGRISRQNLTAENFALKNAVEKFSDVMWAIEQLLFMSFDKRLAVFLFDEITKNNTDTLHYTQEQIAKYVGSAREVVSRMLKIFQSDGILEQTRGNIKILDKSKLKKLTM